MSQSNNNRNNQNNRNSRNHRNGRNKQNGQSKQNKEKEQQKDKKVPMRYQVSNSKETNSVELKNTVDGIVEKTKLSIYEDGSDEAYLKMIKEFRNYVNTYSIWDEENAARTVYCNFRRCLAGAARDLWDQINESEDEEDARDELSFDEHLQELTSAILGDDALRNQKNYLKNTPKPDKMSVKQWINRIKNINSYLLMQPNGRPFTEEDLIVEVISKSIPNAWIKDFKMFKSHLKTSIKEIISELTVIKEQIKPHPKTSQNNSNGKQLKNPCRIHNAGHEWEDCRKNPKNQKDNKNTTTDNRNRNNNKHNNGRTTRGEHRHTEGNESANRNRQRSNSRTRHSESSDREEYHQINNNVVSTVPSSEILLAMPNAKGSKKYTTYLRLIDSGSSGSLVNKEIVEFANFGMQLQKKPIKWDTATGSFQLRPRLTNGVKH